MVSKVMKSSDASGKVSLSQIVKLLLFWIGPTIQADNMLGLLSQRALLISSKLVGFKSYIVLREGDESASLCYF